MQLCHTPHREKEKAKISDQECVADITPAYILPCFTTQGLEPAPLNVLGTHSLSGVIVIPPTLVMKTLSSGLSLNLPHPLLHLFWVLFLAFLLLFISFIYFLPCLSLSSCHKEQQLQDTHLHFIFPNCGPMCELFCSDQAISKF